MQADVHRFPLADPGDVSGLRGAIAAGMVDPGEIVAVIGKKGRRIPAERAREYVFGYAVGNDVTVRDWQQKTPQWMLGKSFDTHCPFGPSIVTADEVGDPQHLEVTLRLNGEVKQHANTSSMIFSVARIISYLSQGLTLEPGDIIATGTPEGVGFARTPPEFLKDGDVMEVEIAKIGILRSPVAIAAPVGAGR